MSPSPRKKFVIEKKAGKIRLMLDERSRNNFLLSVKLMTFTKLPLLDDENFNSIFTHFDYTISKFFIFDN